MNIKDENSLGRKREWEEEQVFIVAKQKDDMDSTDCPYTQKYNVADNFIASVCTVKCHFEKAKCLACKEVTFF